MLLLVDTTALISKGYFWRGLIFITLDNDSPTLPDILSRTGVISANFSTIPVITNSLFLFSGSLVTTLIFFLIFLSPSPLVSILILICPVFPGRICFENETAVHPQSGFTFIISSSASPTFLILKSYSTKLPSTTEPKE